MAPNKDKIWTPRMTMERFRSWTHAPQITEYAPPPKPAPKQRTITKLDTPAVDQLAMQCDAWQTEMERLESECNALEPDNIADRLAALLFSSDLPAKMKEIAKDWDPRGDGSISRGEFRLHIRALGLKATSSSNEDIDILFSRWDEDKSGTIDSHELIAALNNMRTEWRERKGRDAMRLVEATHKIDILRKRTRAAREAIESHAKAEKCSMELTELIESIDRQVSIQLGGLLSRRRMKAGEVVGSWRGRRPLPRPAMPHGGIPVSGVQPGRQRAGQRTALFRENDHLTELTKAEFIAGVQSLGLTIKQQPASSPALGALFDAIDRDRSGFLDLKEAKAALTAWSVQGQQAYADKAAKTKQLSQLRIESARKLQDAVREPEARKPLSAQPAIQVNAMPRPGPAKRMQVLLSRRSASSQSSEAAAQRAQSLALEAAQLLLRQRLTLGWLKWRTWYDERAHSMQVVNDSLLKLTNEMGRGYRQWVTWYLETTYTSRVLMEAALRMQYWEELRALRTWTHRLDERQRSLELQRRARGALTTLRQPKMRTGFHKWVRAVSPTRALADSHERDLPVWSASSLCVALVRCCEQPLGRGARN